MTSFLNEHKLEDGKFRKVKHETTGKVAPQLFLATSYGREIKMNKKTEKLL